MSLFWVCYPSIMFTSEGGATIEGMGGRPSAPTARRVSVGRAQYRPIVVLAASGSCHCCTSLRDLALEHRIGEEGVVVRMVQSKVG